MARITMIAATQGPSAKPVGPARRKRVAAYARVSTGSDEQATSYEAQVEYYERTIKANPSWEFVRIYSDEGITGTSVKNRDGFNEMVKAALAGEIDLILTKSVSRFARNTVDSLTTIRELKAKGVEVYFEKENIYTLDSKGELLLTILSSIAQEESRSISENVKWGVRKSMADGKVRFSWGSFLGYERGPDGKVAIVERQAEVVRAIYRWFLKGKTYREIASELESRGIKSPRGREKWTVSTIMSILSNEKYKGDALLQKTFVVDFLTHQAKKNEGEVPQYYVEGSHPAIIPPDEWELARIERERRAAQGARLSCVSPFSGRVVCGDCGAFYGRKVWHSTDKYRKAIWQCNSKFEGEAVCSTPTLDEHDMEDAFVRAFNALAAKLGSIDEATNAALAAIGDPSSLDAEILAASDEANAWAERARSLVDDNSKRALNQEEWSREYDSVCSRFSEAESRMKALTERKALMATRRASIQAFAEAAQRCSGALDGWDEDVFRSTVEKVVIRKDGALEFLFRNGMCETVR